MTTKDINTLDGDMAQAIPVQIVKPKKKTKKPSPTGDTFTVDTIKGIVTIKHADGTQTINELPVKEVLINKQMINVGMSAAHTCNLGNYESAKITVSLYVPCPTEELEETYNFISDWVNGKMEGITKAIKGN